MRNYIENQGKTHYFDDEKLEEFLGDKVLDWEDNCSNEKAVLEVKTAKHGYLNVWLKGHNDFEIIKG